MHIILASQLVHILLHIYSGQVGGHIFLTIFKQKLGLIYTFQVK